MYFRPFEVFGHILVVFAVRFVLQHHPSHYRAFVADFRPFVGFDHKPVVDFELLAEFVPVGDFQVQNSDEFVVLQNRVLEDEILAEARVCVCQWCFERDLRLF